MVEQVLDFVFGIQWWHWLAGTAALAGLYYGVVGVVLSKARERRREHELLEQVERRKAEEDREKSEAQRREAARQAHLQRIPSGPVKPVALPRAIVVVQHRTVPLPLDAEVTFGLRRDVTVPLVHRGVSREHAKIRPEPRGYVLYDLMSLTGTFVGEERVESKVLADGDVVRIGPVEMRFRLGELHGDGPPIASP
jgi:hypothetical protein